jgi:hypothetical protein
MSLFVIRDKSTQTYCTGQRFRQFHHYLDTAATFVSKQNAEAAIRKMMKVPAHMNGRGWSAAVTDSTVLCFHSNLNGYIQWIDNQCDPRLKQMRVHATSEMIQREMDLEVVEVKLQLV